MNDMINTSSTASNATTSLECAKHEAERTPFAKEMARGPGSLTSPEAIYPALSRANGVCQPLVATTPSLCCTLNLFRERRQRRSSAVDSS